MERQLWIMCLLWCWLWMMPTSSQVGAAQALQTVMQCVALWDLQPDVNHVTWNTQILVWHRLTEYLSAQQIEQLNVLRETITNVFRLRMIQQPEFTKNMISLMQECDQILTLEVSERT